MKKIITVILIVFVSLLLRTYKLGSVPSGFTWDEASLGYNAYSLLKTGKDEFGVTAPLVFKSFGDFKPGLYIYLSVPTIALGGLNEFSTRLPSAIMGSLSVLLIYCLIQQLFPSKNKLVSPGLVGAVLLAINPWAIQFSRGAWEANVYLMLLLLGVNLFLRSRKNQRWYVLSAISFGISFWVYQSAKVFTPIIVCLLLFFYGSKQARKLLAVYAILIILFISPILLNANSESGRLKVLSVFSYTRQQENISKLLAEDNSSVQSPSYLLFHTEILDQLRGVATRYLNHLSPKYLFITGDWSNFRHSIPFYGYFHIPEIILFLVGMYKLIRTKNSCNLFFILCWLLLAPLPAALSRDIVSGVRTLQLVIPIVVISSIGGSLVFNKKVISIPMILVLGFCLVYFLDLYFVHAKHYTAADWLYLYKPSLMEVKNEQNNYKSIVISDKLGQPYIFTLFYLQISPSEYQKSSSFIANTSGDVGSVKSYNKFEFRHIYWPDDRGKSSTLFVGDQYELPESDLATTPNLVTISDVKYPNGSPGFKVVALP